MADDPFLPKAPPGSPYPGGLKTGPGGVPIVSETTTSEIQNEIGEAGRGIRPGYWDQVFEMGVESFGEGPANSLYKMASDAMSRARGTSKLAPEQLNKLYPGVDKPWTEAEYPEVAKIIADRAAVRRERKLWVDRGGETTLGQNLMAGAFQMADPVNIALGGMFGLASKGLGISRKLLPIFAENLAGNIVGEIPNYLIAESERRDPPTYAQILTSSTVGAVIGTGIWKAADSFSKRATTEVALKTAPETARRNAQSAVDQMEAGKALDMTPAAIESAARELGGSKPGVTSEYTPRKLADPNEASYYFPVDDEGRIAPGYREAIGVDNPSVARNMSAYPERAGEGRVIRGRFDPDAKLARLDQRFKQFFPDMDVEQALEKIKGILGDERKYRRYEPIFKAAFENRARLKKVYGDFASFFERQILTEGDEPMQDLFKILDGMGFDGVHMETRVEPTARYEPRTEFDDIADEVEFPDAPLDNRVVVFKPERVEVLEEMQLDRNAVPQLDDDASKIFTEEMNNPTRGEFYDEAMVREMDAAPVTTEALVRETSLDVANSPVDLELKNAEAQVKQFLDEFDDPEIRAEVERYDLDVAKEKQRLEAIKLMTECLGGQMA